MQDAMAWAQKHEAFGQRPIDQPVARYKFGNMARQVEALQAWTEQVVYAGAFERSRWCVFLMNCLTIWSC